MPIGCLPFELLIGDDFVDESHFLGFGGVVLRQIPNFAGFLLSDDAGEVAGAKAAVEAPDFGAGLPEDGVVGGDAEVADDVEDVPAADGVAGNEGDDDFEHGAMSFVSRGR